MHAAAAGDVLRSETHALSCTYTYMYTHIMIAITSQIVANWNLFHLDSVSIYSGGSINCSHSNTRTQFLHIIRVGSDHECMRTRVSYGSLDILHNNIMLNEWVAQRNLLGKVDVIAMAASTNILTGAGFQQSCRSIIAN